MQVSAISQAASFGQARNGISSERISDDEIKELALQATIKQANQRAQRTKKMFLSIPLIAGVAAAVLHTGNSKVLTKEISGVAGKIAEGFKSGGKWTAWLGTGAALGLANAAIAKKSEAYSEFRRNHQILSFLGDAAVFLGVLTAASLGLSKLASKMPGQVEKLAAGVENLAGHVNNIKNIGFIKTIGQKISDFTPAALKNMKTNLADKLPENVKNAGVLATEFGKGLLVLAPHITFLTAMFTGLTNGSRVMGDYASNYEKIKHQVKEAEG